MRFAERVLYCDLEDFHLSKDEALNKGFEISNNIVYIPRNTWFKYLGEQSGASILEVFGEELDFVESRVLVEF